VKKQGMAGLKAITINDLHAAGQGASEHLTPLSVKDFVRLSTFIYDQCGIKITDAKKVMLEARLQKRLKYYNFKSFSQYCDFLFTPDGMDDELIQMIDVVTTNKTDFFREPNHFHFLANKAIPDLVMDKKKRSITVWSAGCSSGEEPYTISMVLSECMQTIRDFSFLILATDISTKVLEKAKIAVYESERIAAIPSECKRKYLLKSKNPLKNLYRIVPELRQTVKFRRLNFMDSDFGFREPIDVIFCRNVIIYFDKATQERLLNRFCEHLAPSGYLFMGHSETLLGMNVPLVQVAPTIYRKAHQ
jgi:chemotaxis protein methyltransferase CheR